MGAAPVLVVPCFNEEHRLQPDSLRPIVDEGKAHLLFVDDGSTDRTGAILDELVGADPSHLSVHHLERNRGKGEAVRLGLLDALATGADVVGYFDADLATPPQELVRLIDTALDHPDLEVVLGSRVALLGHRINRSALRHYLGRLFATLGSVTIKLDVYDTQCGAKLFRAGPTLEAALSVPFSSRWAFDVELLGRLAHGRPGAPAIPLEAWEEVPLREWQDVAGSKLRLASSGRAVLDLLRVRRSVSRWAG